MTEVISQQEALRFKAKSIARGKLLERFRAHVQEIVEHADNEGDRVYFGSTNHFDDLKEIADEMDMWNWDSIIRQRKEIDPYAEMRQLRDEVRRLRSVIERLASHEAFDVALCEIPEELCMRMEFAREALGGSNA